MNKTYKIAVLPGDGTGPEVVAEGIKVLKVASDKFGFKLDFTTFDFGGDRYLKTGEILPDSAADELVDPVPVEISLGRQRCLRVFRVQRQILEPDGLPIRKACRPSYFDKALADQGP